MYRKNQLFIHPTDMCALDCSFCIYANNRKNKGLCFELDLSKGFAQESMTNIIQGAQHIAYSGGGEPFLNSQAIVGCMSLVKEKKYMITTGLGITNEMMEKELEKINEICLDNNSICVLRISVDSFHNNLSIPNKVGEIIKWFLNNRWERIKVCFIRGTITEGKTLLKNLKKFCRVNKYFYICKKINEYTYSLIIKGHYFQVILRPTIFPNKNLTPNEPDMVGYINNLFKIDSEEIILGKPRSCRGCKGCEAWKDGKENGLDITINAKGDVYLYGLEVQKLGNIYDEQVTYELLHSRIESNPIIRKVQSKGLKEVMVAFLNDSVLSEKTKMVNYPFAVIRECMKTNPEDVIRIIERL